MAGCNALRTVPGVMLSAVLVLGLPGTEWAARAPAAGTLLVAASGLGDPNFFQAVVLLIATNKDGTAGLILNRRMETTLARVLPGLDIPKAASTSAFSGGPVDPSRARALLRSLPQRRDAYPVLKDVYLLDSRERLSDALSAGASLDRVRVYVGYAGWGAGQLEREIERDAWHVLEGGSSVVFDPNPDTLWRRQIRRTEIRFAAIIRNPPAGDSFR